MKCANCGHQIQKGKDFCEICGGKILIEDKKAETPVLPPEKTPSVTVDKKTLYIVLGVASGVAVLLLAFAIYFFVVVVSYNESDYKPLPDYSDSDNNNEGNSGRHNTDDYNTDDYNTDDYNTDDYNTDDYSTDDYYADDYNTDGYDYNTDDSGTEPEEAEYYTETTADASLIDPAQRPFIGKWHSYSDSGAGFFVMQIDDYLLWYRYVSESDLSENNENVSMYGYSFVTENGEVKVDLYDYSTDEYGWAMYVEYDPETDSFTDTPSGIVYYRYGAG
jgi:DNA-directed RNA polymerase subunit RPC12/RpoP